MYAGVAALTRLFGEPDEFIRSEVRDGLRAYVYRTGQRAIAIVWRDNGKERAIQLPANVRAYDIMGNQLHLRIVPLNESPAYLVTDRGHADALLRAVANE